jgi:hypothetical protein
VCSFCRSTLLRDGEALKRIGVSAELFDDHSPLQLGVAGQLMGRAFTVVGRQQLAYLEPGSNEVAGSWNEWHVLFDADAAMRSGWLSEDNGAYVMVFDAPLQGEAPAPDELHPGEQRLVNGATWSVASVQRAKLLAAEGELPRPPRLDGAVFVVADLRNQRDEVGTLAWRDPKQPEWSQGRAVRLADLKLSGLREPSEKTLKGRSIECPSCGASLTPKLSGTQSIVCDQCKAVVDLSAGVGGELAHYAQANSGVQPQIPLGKTGTLALGGPPLPWQVVGYVERCEVDVDPGEEQTAWREYLLYHPTEGFNFLVDAEDGWSFARPVTGVPQVRGETVNWQGQTYKSLYSYTGSVTYVLGEFYWRLKRGERTRNTDFASGKRRLNREVAGSEVSWSAGEALDADKVAAAFGLDQMAAMAMKRDVAPLSAANAGSSIKVFIIIAIVMIVLVMLMSQCSSSNDCSSTLQAYGENSNEYRQCLRSNSSGSGVRTSGGSFGGFSSGGGGHK